MIFQGIGGEQHDHGMHAFTFGPDGKFYFNFGNAGEQLLARTGKPVTGIDGKPIDFSKYREGMVFRCDQDFRNVEVLAHNFRNNYEVAVDSYGTMWQSDNDDDGNRGVRINYVMPYGNYGFKDEMTGATWLTPRTNMEDSIPLRHWHLNDPGVVPNLLQTGSGSPTGMVVYEGRLLPKIYWDQMIHCEPGHNVVRSYPVEKAGAGYTASIRNIMDGSRDQWFRPSDVCVAPDGSLIISDWYDPGVGGHQSGDQQKGRLYQIAPAGSRYQIPPSDFTTPAGAVRALQSPNLSVRYLAWGTLEKFGQSAVPALEGLYRDLSNPRMQARALWALNNLKKKEQKYLASAMVSDNPDLRITALRIVHNSRKSELVAVLRNLVGDPDPQVRRECALAMHGNPDPALTSLWAQLARQYPVGDRWYLEALGIGAAGKWVPYFEAWEQLVGKINLGDPGQQDIIWRSRSDRTLTLLTTLASNAQTNIKDRLRYFRAFDFLPDDQGKFNALMSITKGKEKNQKEINSLIFNQIDPKYIIESPEAQKKLQELLTHFYGTDTYLNLVARFEPISENKRLQQLALASSTTETGRRAGLQLLNQGGEVLVWQIVNGNAQTQAGQMLASIKGVGSKESVEILRTVSLSNKYPDPLRIEAVKFLGASVGGEDEVLTLLAADKFSGDLKKAAIQGVSGSFRRKTKETLTQYSDYISTNIGKHPEVATLISMSGQPGKGKEVFSSYCSACHQVNGEGLDFGPKLSEIGGKLTKGALYAAIFEPSAGIGFGYEGSEITLTDGTTLSGIISSKTESDLILKLPGGTTQGYKMSRVKDIKPMVESMMPAGLSTAMSTQELVDLVTYLGTLR